MTSVDYFLHNQIELNHNKLDFLLMIDLLLTILYSTSVVVVHLSVRGRHSESDFTVSHRCFGRALLPGIVRLAPPCGYIVRQ